MFEKVSLNRIASDEYLPRRFRHEVLCFCQITITNLKRQCPISDCIKALKSFLGSIFGGLQSLRSCFSFSENRSLFSTPIAADHNNLLLSPTAFPIAFSDLDALTFQQEHLLGSTYSNNNVVRPWDFSTATCSVFSFLTSYIHFRKHISQQYLPIHALATTRTPSCLAFCLVMAFSLASLSSNIISFPTI